MADDEDDDCFEIDLIPVTPRCCESVEKHQAVFLVMPDTWINGDQKTPPRWCIRSRDPRTGFDTVVDVTYCPFCGQFLPEIVPVVPERPVCVCTDNGYYCDTCKERLGGCRCLQPTKAWGPYAYDPKFGDDRVCECGHQYYRHFDTWDDMKAVGCKYCGSLCYVFKEKSNDPSGASGEDSGSSG